MGCKVVECEHDVKTKIGHDQLQKDKLRNIAFHLQLGQYVVQQHTNLFEEKLVSLGWVEIEISNLEQHLANMGEGAHVVFFPQLFLRDLHASIKREKERVNGCPICNCWHNCNNHINVVCGHTYHPFYLARFVATQRKCLLAMRLDPLLIGWLQGYQTIINCKHLPC